MGVACELGYPCTKFRLPRPFGFRVRADVYATSDRQTDGRTDDGRRSPLNAPSPTGRGHNNVTHTQTPRNPKGSAPPQPFVAPITSPRIAQMFGVLMASDYTILYLFFIFIFFYGETPTAADFSLRLYPSPQKGESAPVHTHEHGLPRTVTPFVVCFAH